MSIICQSHFESTTKGRLLTDLIGLPAYSSIWFCLYIFFAVVFFFFFYGNKLNLNLNLHPVTRQNRGFPSIITPLITQWSCVSENCSERLQKSSTKIRHPKLCVLWSLTIQRVIKLTFYHGGREQNLRIIGYTPSIRCRKKCRSERTRKICLWAIWKTCSKIHKINQIW